VAASKQAASLYSVRVNGKSFQVEVAEGGQLSDVRPVATTAGPAASAATAGDAVKAVLAGNIFKVHVSPGEQVTEGQPLLVVEAMKMETAISAPKSGTVIDVYVSEGDVVSVGDPLVAIG
jgi:oxaloacetate decarboxylase alpha subunit